jgi:hypothetical protein
MTDYDTDLYAWSECQGALLRRLATGENVDRDQLDWTNIAEEIETLGRAERRSLATRISNIAENLILLETISHDGRQRADRVLCIERARMEIERLLSESPSLREQLATLLTEEMQTARRLAAITLEEIQPHRAVDLQRFCYPLSHILGGWLPSG